jgi:hypothetical protein
MAALGHGGDKTFQFVKPLVSQQPVSSFIEQQRRRLSRCRRTICAGTKMHRARAIVAQVQLGERRMVAAREGRLGTALLLQRGKNKLDVLTGSQFVGGVIGAGAIVVARLLAANGHAVGALRLRVTDAELRKERLGADILQPENLFAAELTPQCALPVDWRKFRRSVSAG